MTETVGFEIRAAHANDDIAVSALIAESAAHFQHELGEQDVVGEGMRAREYYDKGGLFVADIGGSVVGCVAYEPWGEGRCRMKRMYVLEDARGQGIGRALADAVIEEARAQGYGVMVLDTTESMTAAQALYRKIGFKDWDPDYEAPCRDTVYMRMEL